MAAPDVNAWMAQTDASIAELRGGLAGLTGALADINTHLAQLDTKIAQANARISAVETRLNALEVTKPNPPIEPPQPTWTAKFPGDAKPGELRWGSAYGGNTEPGTRYGTPGRAISRTYWDMSKVAQSVTRAASDVAKGALPWVSYKVGGWAAFANGGSDAAFKDLITKLNAIGKPIWISVHHEPEGSGEFGTDEGTPTDRSSIDNWRNMQKKVRQLINSVPHNNIAFSCCMMSWSWDARSNRKPAYWVDGMEGTWDFFGVDCYNDTKSPATQKYADMDMWKALVGHANRLNLRIGLGEWGTRGTAADIAAQRQDFIDKGCVGVAYFDSDLNSPTGAWLLTPEQLSMFVSICPTSPRI